MQWGMDRKEHYLRIILCYSTGQKFAIGNYQMDHYKLLNLNPERPNVSWKLFCIHVNLISNLMYFPN